MRMLLGAGLCLLLMGCGGEDAPRAAVAGQELPVTTSASIEVGGRTEAVSLQRYESPPEFALPFVTYLPTGMQVGVAADEPGGDAVRFQATDNPDAFVQVFVHPVSQSVDAAIEDVRGVAESYGVPGVGEVNPADRHPWALAEYEFRSRGTITPPVQGYVSLGQHAGRLFHVIVQYPVGFAETFLPRAHLILDSWRWKDTSLGLRLD